MAVEYCIGRKLPDCHFNGIALLGDLANTPKSSKSRLRRRTKTRNCWQRLSSGTMPFLLSTTAQQRHGHHQVSHANDRPRALRPADLVRRDNEKVTAAGGNIERNPPISLYSVHNQHTAITFDQRRNSCNRLDHASLIVGMMNANQRQSSAHVMGRKRALQRGQIKLARPGDRQNDEIFRIELPAAPRVSVLLIAQTLVPCTNRRSALVSGGALLISLKRIV